jgi:cell division protein FtsZ
VFRLIDEHTSLLEAFHLTNELVAQGVRGIWRLLCKPGLIHVDFADLCAVTRDKHAESCLATAEALGENRAREVMEKLLAHPQIEGGQALAESAGVLVSIAAGQSLTLGEVNRITEQINRLCEHAHLILGASIDETLGERLSVTLVASCRSPAAGAPHHAEGPSDLVRVAEWEAEAGGTEKTGRMASRFVAPPPLLTPEKTEQLFVQQTQGGSRSRRNASRLKQGQLPLEIVSRGRFEKSEPTLHQGQDLDVPTYIRRGVALN